MTLLSHTTSSWSPANRSIAQPRLYPADKDGRGACGKWIFYPLIFCPYCFSEDVIWERVTGHATLYIFIISHTPRPGFPPESCPYVTAIVELEEGVRMFSNRPIVRVERMDIAQTYGR